MDNFLCLLKHTSEFAGRVCNLQAVIIHHSQLVIRKYEVLHIDDTNEILILKELKCLKHAML